MQQASCLEGGPLLWIWPLYLHVNKKSDDDDDDDDDDDMSIGVQLYDQSLSPQIIFVSSHELFWRYWHGERVNTIQKMLCSIMSATLSVFDTKQKIAQTQV